MRINYLILTHKAPEQVRLLSDALLQCPDNRVFIHVDKRVALNDFVTRFGFLNYARCTFLENRAAINWGGISYVDAALRLLRESLKNKADYYVLLSGQDLPIKSSGHVSSFYEHSNGRNYIHNFPVEGTRWDYRIKNYFLPYAFYRNCKDRVVPLQRFLGIDHGRILWQKGIVPYGGSGWWSLAHEAVIYIFSFLEQNPWFYNFFKWSWCPDEMFFQTILMNSPLSETIINDNYLFFRWEGWPFGGSHPLFLTIEDHAEIMRSSALYARKFDIERDTKIIHKILGKP